MQLSMDHMYNSSGYQKPIWIEGAGRSRSMVLIGYTACRLWFDWSQQEERTCSSVSDFSKMPIVDMSLLFFISSLESWFMCCEFSTWELLCLPFLEHVSVSVTTIYCSTVGFSSVIKMEAPMWVSFWRALKFQPCNWRASSNPRRQSKNIEMKYKTHIKLVHELYGTCFPYNVKN
jgi:hypothetical protein